MKLSDDRINRLVRMALEAEALEGDGPALSIAREHDAAAHRARAHRRWVMGSTLALAAGVMLTVAGVFVLRPSGTAPVQPPTPLAIERGRPAELGAKPKVEPTLANRQSGPTNVRVAQTVGLQEQGVVVVIAHSPETGAHCVQWGPAESWSTKCLSDVSEDQLRSVRLKGMCSERRPTVTRIALAGPASALPMGDAKAAMLADCILRSDRPCDGSGACYLSAASNCLPPNVSVRIESVTAPGE